MGATVNIGGKQLVLGDSKGPSELQELFMRAPEMEQLIGGAKRGGKSVGLCQKAIMLSLAFPGNRGGMFRQDLTDLRDSLLVTFFNICPKELILEHHQTHKTITLKTAREPSVILYGGLGDVHDVESAKGKEFGWFLIDEPSEVDESAYLMLLAQLCWRLPGGKFPPYMAMLGSNPEPGWVHERFRGLIEETSNEKRVAREDGRVFIRALPKDNPYLPPGWENRMRMSAPDAWVKKYLDGSWEVSEGQVYKEFDRGTHVIQSLSPASLSRLTLIGALDHATTGVTCFTAIGLDPDGNLFALAEYYERNRLISEHAKSISAVADFWVDACGKRAAVNALAPSNREVYPAFLEFEYVLIDPSTQAKTLQNRNELWSVQ